MYIAYLSHRRYLRQNKRCLYQYLFLTVKLDAHLREIDHAVNEMFSQLTKQMTAAEGVTEALKAAGRMEWVRRTNSIRSRVREIVNSERIYN
ncbi:MAG: TnpV protein [Butyricicoccus sp.]|nr:TnpV protein [Clostridiaceae bacterium]MEE0032817.1 TnpV protein [Agathobaculum butyriciproducens]